MAKRKLVKQGAATLMISLPSKWAKRLNLSKGNELEVEEKGNSLVISTEGTAAKTEITINLSSLTASSIRTIITNSYRIGFDKINLQFSHKNALPSIKEVVDKNLLGFEIIKISDNSCTIENVTEPSKEQFDNIFSKVFLNIEDLYSVAEEMLNGKDAEFEDTERNILRYDNFCRRVISKEGANSPAQWAFHGEIIHAQREIYFLLKYLSRKKIKYDKGIKEIFEQSRVIFSTLKEAYFKKSISALEKVHELERKLEKEALMLLDKEKNATAVHNILSASRMFYLANSPLMAILISEKVSV